MVETAGHLDYGGDAVQWGGDGDCLGGAVPETQLTVLVTTEYKHLPTLSAGWSGRGGGVIIVCYTCTVGVEREANSLWTRLANMAIV